MNNPYVKTLEPVWHYTKDVWVNEEKLQELIKDMKQKKKRGELAIPAWNISGVHPPMDCDLSFWINYVCWINTVNFAFTNFKRPWNKFTVEYPIGVFWRGSLAMQACFMRALQEGIPITDAEYMSKISLKDVKYIFRSIDDQHQTPMLKERWQIFREAGQVLLRCVGGWLDLFVRGDFYAFNRGKGIVELLVADFPSFRDVRHYRGRCLEFHKRAQLLVMMYHGRAVNSGSSFPLIKDIEDIGPIADYEVPKALRFLGVLEYSARLKDAIKNHKAFMPNDPEETENRLAMSYVMKKICDEAGVNMAQADFYVWQIGRSSGIPHILVPTVDY